MTKKTVAAFCSLLVFAPLLFSQQASKILEERYLKGANDFYTQKNYVKAFEYINIVLANYNQNNLPQNIELLAETVYFSYLEQIRDEKDMEAFNTVKNRLLDFPILSSDRIARIIRTINAQENQPQAMPNSDVIKAVADAEKRAALSQAELDRIREAKAALEKDLESVKQQSSDSGKIEKQLQDISSKTESNNAVMMRTISITVGVVIVIFAIILIISIINARNTKKQQKQFEATLQLVAKMTRIPGEHLGIANLTDIYDDSNVRQAGSSKHTSTALPKPEMTEEERTELRQLADKCEELGNKIDIATGRKNNSKNVAEMVFKIAHALNLGSYDSMLYFCAAMVYDAGFLQIDQELLQKEILSEDDKYTIRRHVQNGVNQLDFVPDRYKPVFVDAALMHHENMDGSGYPEGLSGEQIPIVARLIHVVETFVALISRRNYRGIFDKESAIAEMRKQPGIYDPNIIDALDSLV